MPIEFNALDYEPKGWEPEDVVRIRNLIRSRQLPNEVSRATTLREFDEDIERVRQWLYPENWEI